MDNIKFASTFTSNFESLFLDIDPIMAHPAKTETKVVQAIEDQLIGYKSMKRNLWGSHAV